MKANEKYWRKQWDLKGGSDCSDFQVDRGVSNQIEEIKKFSDEQFITSLAPKNNEIILDAGCGTGINVLRISSLVKGVVGIDISSEMLRRTKNRVMTENLRNVSLLHGSVSKIAIKDNTFDKIYCTSVLQFLNDEECKESLAELIRVSKKNGMVVLHVKNRSSLYGWTLYVMKKFARLINRPVRPDYYRTNTWYDKNISKFGAKVIDYNSFGVFNISHLPKSIVHWLLKWEMKIEKGKFIKRHGVNYQITIKVNK
jgi:ubiquinone/menaquinone biosynthesis C-methylase UbiE